MIAAPRRRSLLRFALIATSAALAFVAGAQAPRDSAGIRIVENGSRLKAPVVFRLGPGPAFDVGGVQPNPAEQFQPTQPYLRGVRRPDGGMDVIDVTRVHYFDAAAKRTAIAGQKGSGPGEFLYLSAICRTQGDSIVVGDSNNRRYAVLDKAGGFVRTIPQGELGFAPFNFCFDDGTFVLSLPIDAAGERQVRVTRVRLDGTVANRIGDFPAGAFDMITTREVQIAAWGKQLFFGDAMSSQILVMNTEGKVSSIIRTDDPPAAITNDELEKRIASTMPPNLPAEERTQRIARLRAMPHAATWPSYGRMHVDPTGRLWVQDYQTTYPAPDGWTAFDPSGRMVGRFVFPAPPQGARTPEVIGFGVDQIILRRSDADGAAHLSVYPLVRVPGGNP